MTKSNFKYTLFYGSRFNSLRPESQKILKKNTRISIIALAIISAGSLLMSYFETSDLAWKAWSFSWIGFILLSGLYQLSKGETYYQLRSKDKKADQVQSKKMLKEMKATKKW